MQILKSAQYALYRIQAALVMAGVSTPEESSTAEEYALGLVKTLGGTQLAELLGIVREVLDDYQKTGPRVVYTEAAQTRRMDYSAFALNIVDLERLDSGCGPPRSLHSGREEERRQDP